MNSTAQQVKYILHQNHLILSLKKSQDELYH